MGGLLAADAIADASSVSKRIIGLVAFDVPFLGMHPHVIISGIASLLPKEKSEPEIEMNDARIVKMEPSKDANTKRDSSMCLACCSTRLRLTKGNISKL